MQRITQTNLNAVARIITKTLDNGRTHESGRWSFACRSEGGGSSELLNDPTKTALYNAMHAFLSGVRETKQWS